MYSRGRLSFNAAQLSASSARPGANVLTLRPTSNSFSRSSITPARSFTTSQYTRHAPIRPPPPPGKPSEKEEGEEEGETKSDALSYGPNVGGGMASGNPFTTGSSVLDAAITTVIGLTMVFFGGVAYVSWYKKNVLDKIELAFAGGYDPALELATHSKNRVPIATGEDWQLDGFWTEHLRRKEQDLLDRIIHGSEAGHYFMLLGPKGTGKTTMVIDAMQTCQAEGVAICDAHPDLEVFRLRLGKALNYEYNEDSQTGLFQRRDPREGGPALDIERAMNKLEKVALRYSRRTGRPLVLIINNVHFFQNNDEGRNILLQMQQRAEAWSASGILTFVFSSDDFWPFFAMRKTASRMHVVSVYDLNYKEAHHAALRIRQHARHSVEPLQTYRDAIALIGGRLSYIGKVAKAKDMVAHAEHMLSVEKAWLLSQIGLIEDCDDDVMDEQKWSSCSWLLLREFVKRRQEAEKQVMEEIEQGTKTMDDLLDLPLPKIPYYQCRQIMTRADFLEELDRCNIIAIDINHDVTPDSLLLLRAAREVVEEEGFDDSLDSVRDRVDEIESLHRTRELTFKDVAAGDRIRLTVDKGGARLVEDR
ncbi:hypothetical protein C8Q75DRAFT_762549 [Abortiporus biennis]|nr:hypothetical protein C8Q75DRAFT_762549 [Abortiporus biennis]